MKKKVALHNLGCKVNAYEIEAMQQLLEKEGYDIVPFLPGADIYIINTCTVTNIADRKSRQMLHKAKKMNDGAIVVATGCYVQADRERLEADEAIDLVIGNNKKKNIVEILREYEDTLAADAPKESCKASEGLERVIDINQTGEYEALTISRTAEHARVYIKVQDGCNQFCSYCIIPYARGRVRSRRKEDVAKEVERLAGAGYQEVVLTGIHLSSYGIDFKDEEETLLTLLEHIHQVEGISRIRLGSLEPRIITEKFARKIAALPKVCPHFHLSLQSGCDNTLKQMNRRYDCKEYREKCELLRNVYENPALTTDIIVGFPGETDADFQESYEFVKEIGFYETHVFKYSKRKGTKAAKMQEQISEALKGRRSEQLLKLHQQNVRAYAGCYLNKEVEILVEEKTEIQGQQWYVGHTREYIKAAVLADRDYPIGEALICRGRSLYENHMLLCER